MTDKGGEKMNNSKKPGEPLETEHRARLETTIRLPPMLWQQLSNQADRLGVTLHDLILFILWGAVTHIPQE